ncbi:GNAT family N-acetyltransferase [Bradyrhizobium ontarionense]|uniref:GNAT family N-acetyltransferase n=1 Tax=Bradyrhizobium ontarionense TaxID=2898149 RepID=A0ABY3RFH2_9BRAD|nr:GNAT family N-acetyltransferase [Bradyrhizobium sp. A19]UFZ05730.1 GNAT family N-acetyltransferase [Bradyrhizobium sp. A19]
MRLRLAEPGDEPFLRDLFRTVKGVQLAAGGLPPAMLDLVLAQQYGAQVAGYAAQFPAARSLIVLEQGIPIGRLLLDCGTQQWHVVDVALLPSARNMGVGHAVMEAVATAAREQNVAVLTLAVATTNEGARRFYRRLGFTEMESDATASHLRMQLPLGD